MTIIEGVGDEVVNFFAVVLLLGLGLIAWWSTRISDLPPIRTVLIFERRTQTEVNHRSSISASQSERTTNEPPEACPTPVPNNNESPSNEENSSENLKESGPSVATRQDSEESDKTKGDEEKSKESSRSETPASEEAGAAAEPSSETPSEQDSIRIRLKYLNDDQKLVQGQLHELLGDFKRRHFSLELSREKRVRLIFNGQVLQSDEQTLQGCGLYDNCVVHCLVHTQFNVNRNSSQTSSHANPSPPEWNLSGLLYLSLSLLLGFAWFFRFHYSQLFTLTTTTALTGLTAMFAISIIGMYMPNQEAPPA